MTEHAFDFFVNLFYYEGDLLRTFISLFGFVFTAVVFLEMVYCLKSSVHSARD